SFPRVTLRADRQWTQANEGSQGHRRERRRAVADDAAGQRCRARSFRPCERRRLATVPPLDLEGAFTAPATPRTRSFAVHVEGLSQLGEAGEAQLVFRKLTRLTAPVRTHAYSEFHRVTMLRRTGMSQKYERSVESLKNESARQRWELFHRAIASAKQSN